MRKTLMTKTYDDVFMENGAFLYGLTTLPLWGFSVFFAASLFSGYLILAVMFLLFFAAYSLVKWMSHRSAIRIWKSIILPETVRIVMAATDFHQTVLPKREDGKRIRCELDKIYPLIVLNYRDIKKGSRAEFLVLQEMLGAFHQD